MIVYRKALLRVAETFFDEAVDSRVRFDVVRQYQRPTPSPKGRCEEFYTRLLDLRESPEAIFAGMRNETRRQIRKAEKDGVTCESRTGGGQDWTAQFLDFFDRFARSKRLPRANRQRLQAFDSVRKLDLSRVTDPSGEILVWHAFYRNGRRARLLHSASLFREVSGREQCALIGRANRLLHWRDILRYRADGMLTYDLGGWYTGQTDREKLAINQFKAGFGGVVAREMNTEICATLPAFLIVGARRLFYGLRNPLRDLAPFGSALATKL